MIDIRLAFACFLAALTVTMATGCASTSGQDGTGEYVSDTELTAQVKAAHFQ